MDCWLLNVSSSFWLANLSASDVEDLFSSFLLVSESSGSLVVFVRDRLP